MTLRSDRTVRILVAIAALMLASCRESSKTPEVRVADPLPEAAEALDPAADFEHVDSRGKATVAIDHTQGGEIALENGTRVVLPSGALVKSGAVTVEQVHVDAERNGLIAPLSYVVVEPPEGASSLASPATISVALPETERPLGTGDVVIHHLNRSGVMSRIEDVTVDEGRATFETPSFSTFFLMIEQYLYGELANEVVRGNRKQIIETPYYSQATYEWCWAASAAMCFASQGTPVQPHRIAELFRAQPSFGGSFIPFDIPNQVQLSFSEVANQFGGPGPESIYKRYRLGGITEQRLRGWILSELMKGHPVWAGLRQYKKDGGGDHAVFITGYDNVGFYVHDPSGALIDEVYKRRAARPGPSGRNLGAVDPSKLAYFHIRYGEWEEINAFDSDFPRPWVESFAVIERPLPADRSLATLQIPPDRGPTHFEFVRDTIRMADLRSRIFYWNGAVAYGCGFSQGNVTEEERGLGSLCNSDGVAELRPVIHNTDDVSFWGAVRVLIDDEQAAVDVPALHIPKHTTNHVLEVVPARSLARRTDDPWRPAPYTTPAQRAKLPVADSLDFVRNPLRPGMYTLSLLLYGLGNRVVDRIDIPLGIDPALVRDIKAEKVRTKDGKVGHRVMFSPSPEAGRAPGPHVYRVHRYKLGSTAPELVATLTNPSDLAATVPFPDGTDPATRYLYDVVYVHSSTQRTSPPGQPSIPLDGKPVQRTSNATRPAAFVLEKVELRENNSSREAAEIKPTHTLDFNVGDGGFGTVAGTGRVELTFPTRLDFREFRPPAGKVTEALAIGLVQPARFAFKSSIRVAKPKPETSLGFHATWRTKTLSDRDYARFGRDSHVVSAGEDVDPFKRNAGQSTVRLGHDAAQLRRWYAGTFGVTPEEAAALIDSDGFIHAERRTRRVGGTNLDDSFEVVLPTGSEVYRVRERRGVREIVIDVRVMTSYDPLPRPNLPRSAMLPEPNGFGSLGARLTYRLSR